MLALQVRLACADSPLTAGQYDRLRATPKAHLSLAHVVQMALYQVRVPDVKGGRPSSQWPSRPRTHLLFMPFCAPGASVVVPTTTRQPTLQLLLPPPHTSQPISAQRTKPLQDTLDDQEASLNRALKDGEACRHEADRLRTQMNVEAERTRTLKATLAEIRVRG